MRFLFIAILLLTLPLMAWEVTYGPSDFDVAYDIIESGDGGFLAVGYTWPSWDEDVYVVHLNEYGDSIAAYSYGGSGDDAALSVCRDYSDFVMGGYTSSDGAGGLDFYILKIDDFGSIIWENTVGGSSDDGAYSICGCSDGGFILVGYTESYGAGGSDVYIVKTDSWGDTLWTRTYGGIQDDIAHSVIEITGGYMIAGCSKSFSSGDWDAYLIKIDDYGDTIWTETYDDGDDEIARGVISTWSDYILCGDKGTDMMLISIDSDGSMNWINSYGGYGQQNAWGLDEAADGGYIMAGYTDGVGTDDDLILLKTDNWGDSLWARVFDNGDDDYGNAVRTTSEDGFIIGGYTYSGSSYDFYVIKADSTGDSAPDTTSEPDYFITPDNAYYFINSSSTMWNSTYLGGLSSDTFPTWEIFKEAFGESQVEDGMGEPLPAANSFRMSIGSTNGWHGSCFGFAASSALFYQGIFDLADPRWGDPSIERLYDVAPGHDIKTLIHAVQLRQYGRLDVNDYRYDVPDDNADLIRRLSARMVEDTLLMAFFWEEDGHTHGHALVPFDIDNLGEDLFRVMVYDNWDSEDSFYFLIDTTYGAESVEYVRERYSNVIPNRITLENSAPYGNEPTLPYMYRMHTPVHMVYPIGDFDSIRVDDVMYDGSQIDGECSWVELDLVANDDIEGDSRIRPQFKVLYGSFDASIANTYDTNGLMLSSGYTLLRAKQGGSSYSNQVNYSCLTNYYTFDINSPDSIDIHQILTDYGDQYEWMFEFDGSTPALMEILPTDDSLIIQNLGSVSSYDFKLIYAQTSGDRQYWEPLSTVPINMSERQKVIFDPATGEGAILRDYPGGSTYEDTIISTSMGMIEDSNELFAQIQVSPNPFNSAVEIVSPQNTRIEIIDMRGKIVETSYGGSFVWNPHESIGSGIYLVRATYSDKQITKRIVYLK